MIYSIYVVLIGDQIVVKKHILYSFSLLLITWVMSCESVSSKNTSLSYTRLGFKGNDLLKTVKQNQDGSFIMIGRTDNYRDNSDILIVFTDAYLNPIWFKAIGSERADYGMDITETSDGNFLAACTAEVPGNNKDIVALLLDRNGKLLSSKNYGGSGPEEAQHLIQFDHDQFALIGNTGSFGHGASDIWLIVLNALGDSTRSYTFGTVDDEHALGAIRSLNGSIYCTGYVSATTYAPFLLMINSDMSNHIWTRYPAKNSRDEAHDIKETLNGDLIMVGRTNTLRTPYESYDAQVFKTNANGVKSWDMRFGKTKYDILESCTPTQDNGCIVVGNALHVSPKYVANQQALIARIQSTGDTVWTRQIGSASPDEAVCIMPIGLNRFLVGGNSRNGPYGDWDFVFFIIDENGNHDFN